MESKEDDPEELPSFKHLFSTENDLLRQLKEKTKIIKKFEGKYKKLFYQFRIKLCEADELKKNSDVLQERLNGFINIETELSILKGDHESLNNTYLDYMNSSQLKYQQICLENSQLETTIKQLQKKLEKIDLKLKTSVEKSAKKSKGEDDAKDSPFCENLEAHNKKTVDFEKKYAKLEEELGKNKRLIEELQGKCKNVKNKKDFRLSKNKSLQRIEDLEKQLKEKTNEIEIFQLASEADYQKLQSQLKKQTDLLNRQISDLQTKKIIPKKIAVQTQTENNYNDERSTSEMFDISDNESTVDTDIVINILSEMKEMPKIVRPITNIHKNMDFEKIDTPVNNFGSISVFNNKPPSVDACTQINENEWISNDITSNKSVEKDSHKLIYFEKITQTNLTNSEINKWQNSFKTVQKLCENCRIVSHRTQTDLHINKIEKVDDNQNIKFVSIGSQTVDELVETCSEQNIQNTNVQSQKKSLGTETDRFVTDKNPVLSSFDSVKSQEIIPVLKTVERDLRIRSNTIKLNTSSTQTDEYLTKSIKTDEYIKNKSDIFDDMRSYKFSTDSESTSSGEFIITKKPPEKLKKMNILNKTIKKNKHLIAYLKKKKLLRNLNKYFPQMTHNGSYDMCYNQIPIQFVPQNPYINQYQPYYYLSNPNYCSFPPSYNNLNGINNCEINYQNINENGYFADIDVPVDNYMCSKANMKNDSTLKKNLNKKLRKDRLKQKVDTSILNTRPTYKTKRYKISSLFGSQSSEEEKKFRSSNSCSKMSKKKKHSSDENKSKTATRRYSVSSISSIDNSSEVVNSFYMNETSIETPENYVTPRTRSFADTSEDDIPLTYQRRKKKIKNKKLNTPTEHTEHESDYETDAPEKVKNSIARNLKKALRNKRLTLVNTDCDMNKKDAILDTDMTSGKRYITRSSDTEIQVNDKNRNPVCLNTNDANSKSKQETTPNRYSLRKRPTSSLGFNDLNMKSPIHRNRRKSACDSLLKEININVSDGESNLLEYSKEQQRKLEPLASTGSNLSSNIGIRSLKGLCDLKHCSTPKGFIHSLSLNQHEYSNSELSTNDVLFPNTMKTKGMDEDQSEFFSIIESKVNGSYNNENIIEKSKENLNSTVSQEDEEISITTNNTKSGSIHKSNKKNCSDSEHENNFPVKEQLSTSTRSFSNRRFKSNKNRRKSTSDILDAKVSVNDMSPCAKRVLNKLGAQKLVTSPIITRSKSTQDYFEFIQKNTILDTDVNEEILQINLTSKIVKRDDMCGKHSKNVNEENTSNQEDVSVSLLNLNDTKNNSVRKENLNKSQQFNEMEVELNETIQNINSGNNNSTKQNCIEDQIETVDTIKYVSEMSNLISVEKEDRFDSTPKTNSKMISSNDLPDFKDTITDIRNSPRSETIEYNRTKHFGTIEKLRSSVNLETNKFNSPKRNKYDRRTSLPKVPELPVINEDLNSVECNAHENNNCNESGRHDDVDNKLKTNVEVTNENVTKPTNVNNKNYSLEENAVTTPTDTEINIISLRNQNKTDITDRDSVESSHILNTPRRLASTSTKLPVRSPTKQNKTRKNTKNVIQNNYYTRSKKTETVLNTVNRCTRNSSKNSIANKADNDRCLSPTEKSIGFTQEEIFNKDIERQNEVLKNVIKSVEKNMSELCHIQQIDSVELNTANFDKNNQLIKPTKVNMLDLLEIQRTKVADELINSDEIQINRSNIQVSTNITINKPMLLVTSGSERVVDSLASKSVSVCKNSVQNKYSLVSNRLKSHIICSDSESEYDSDLADLTAINQKTSINDSYTLLTNLTELEHNSEKELKYNSEKMSESYVDDIFGSDSENDTLIIDTDCDINAKKDDTKKNSVEENNSSSEMEDMFSESDTDCKKRKRDIDIPLVNSSHLLKTNYQSTNVTKKQKFDSVNLILPTIPREESKHAENMLINSNQNSDILKSNRIHSLSIEKGQKVDSLLEIVEQPNLNQDIFNTKERKRSLKETDLLSEPVSEVYLTIDQNKQSSDFKKLNQKHDLRKNNQNSVSESTSELYLNSVLKENKQNLCEENQICVFQTPGNENTFRDSICIKRRDNKLDLSVSESSTTLSNSDFGQNKEIKQRKPRTRRTVQPLNKNLSRIRKLLNVRNQQKRKIVVSDDDNETSELRETVKTVEDNDSCVNCDIINYYKQKKRVAHIPKEEQPNIVKPVCNNVFENRLNETKVDSNELVTGIGGFISKVRNTRKDKVGSVKSVFKKPEKSKFKIIPATPKSPDVMEYVTSVPAIIPLEKVAQFPLGLLRKHIKTVLNAEDLTHDILDTVVKELSAQDPNKIAKIIVEEVIKKPSEELDKTFTPPAPLMTKTQQKATVFLNKLANIDGHKNIHDCVLKWAHKRLMWEQKIVIVHSLTRLYIGVSMQVYDSEQVCILLTDAAYCMGDNYIVVAFLAFTMYPEVLPTYSELQERNKLEAIIPKVLVHIIKLKTCNRPGYNLKNLNFLLNQHFGYQIARESNENLMEDLIHLYTETGSKIVYTAIVLLCKNLPNAWTFAQIEKYFMPLVNKNIHDTTCTGMISTTIDLITRISLPFIDDSKEDTVQRIRDWLLEIAEANSNLPLSIRKSVITNASYLVAKPKCNKKPKASLKHKKK